MAYLLAKYSLLFLITAILGFVFGYWWSRRNFVDVTESFEDLRTANDRSDRANWAQLWKRLDMMPAPVEPDFSPTNRRIDEIDSAISQLPRVEPASVTGIQQQLKDLLGLVRQMSVPVDTPASFVEPLREEVMALRQSVESSGERAPQIDMAPMLGKIERLEDAVRKTPAPQRVDLGSVVQRLDAIESNFRAFPLPQDVNLEPVERRLESIETEFRGWPVPRDVDLEPVVQRLDSIEAEVRGLKVSGSVDPGRMQLATVRDRSEPVILSAALYGTKDNLQQISGVGPKLERLLNKNGIFYFWQVASWDGGDISVMDSRLDSFKGRISRDDWVTQATTLSRKPGAASMPDEHRLR